MLEDLFDRESVARVERAKLLKQVFKCTTRLVPAVDLPELELLLASQPLIVRVLQDSPSKRRKFKAHNKQGYSGGEDVRLHGVVQPDLSLLLGREVTILVLPQFTFLLLNDP